ncbi:uncharacterized protein LOC123352472 isoform X7 [Mauremys mutica]|uniref:uncharacterized protein LOC123352472 isoform X7 n=1 Tax=Mauremys mutica TaxID=74926 RepID=UPI001D166D3D|nr:uncharacterized protein LOC123352472 isoform X7 [Mauremys mutica]
MRVFVWACLDIAAAMARAGCCWRVAVRVALELTLASCVWGLCPAGWLPYRNTLCLFVPAKGPALSWSRARAFCQERKAELIVIGDYRKQIFLTELTDRGGGPGSQYWMGLARLAGEAELTWVDGTPISKSWYRNWLWSHPKGEHCVQLVGFYLNQWRDWDCNSTSSFICEMPATDAFPSSMRAVRFRAHCYTFHFPALWEMRTWPQALAFCKQSGGSLASVQGEDENVFLSDAFPADGWHMWIGLQFSTAWRWSDTTVPVYYKWHHPAVANLSGQCAVMALRPSDLSRHGTWETRGCDTEPPTKATGFFCKDSPGSCGLPAPVEFPLPGGMGPYATADVVFSLPRYSVCTVMLTKAYTRAALFQLRLESNATHVYGSLAAEFTGASVQKELVPVPFATGLSTWGFITFPTGMIGFFNHQEHFRVFSDRAISFANLGSLLISGVTVANASLEYRASSAMRLPSGKPALRSALRLENAVTRYLSGFTLGLWVRSTFASSNKMGLLSYWVRSRPAELALFLLAPAGLELWLKGAVMLRGTAGLLLDGSWHHLAISISSDLSASPYMVFIDGEPWEPDFADSAGFLRKGLAVGGVWNVGQPAIVEKGGLTVGSPYVGELSEVNLWDRALPRLSVKQLAASRDKWKFPGNVVSWSQLADGRSGAVEIPTASHSAAAGFVWLGLLWLVGHPSVLCSDPERALVYVEPAAECCPKNSLWGLQLDGRLRSLASSSCLLVGLDGVSLGCKSDCSSDGRSSFRLLPDQRLQNLHSGFCVFRKPRSPGLFLQKCSSQALRFALDEDVHCPRAPGWRSRKNKCLHVVAGAALEWSQALRYCQRFQNGSLLTLSSPEDRSWLQEALSWSVWTGLHGARRSSLHKWADGTSFNKDLQSWILPAEVPSEMVCVLLLPSGFLKEEPCQRPHRWVCQTPQRNGFYEEVSGKSFYGSLSAEGSFSSLVAAKAQCTSLGRGCSAVVSTAGSYYLYRGTRFVNLEDPATDPTAAVHIKAGCVPGYTGQDCQSECPACDAGVSCNPLTGTCDGLLYSRQPAGAQAAAYTSLKCPPFAGWVFKHGSCVLLEHKGSQREAELVCRRYLAAEVLEIKPAPDLLCGTPSEGRGPEKRYPSSSLWSCQRAEEVELPALREKLLVSFQDFVWQKHASLRAAKDSCFLQRENCTGVTQLQGAYYTVNGTVLVDSPGSGATLYVKSACSPGYSGVRCARRCLPCPGTRTCNPLSGCCEGLLSCVRRVGPSCLHVPSSRCPTEPGWRHWNGSCYYLDSSLAGSTWQEGLRMCRQFRQTELLYLTSRQEKDWVCSHFRGAFWTGLNDQTDESVFQWTTRDPITRQLAEHLRDDLADGGLKDCVWLDTASGLLTDASCEERKPFICKCSEATEWFVKQPGRGVVGDPAFLHPSAESLEQAKQECLRERSVCAAVLQAGTGVYLISSTAGIISRPNSTLYIWTICAEGFSGLRCHRYTAPQERPACDCSGRVRVSAAQVCGVPVQRCVDYCRHTTARSNCSLCLPLCSDSSLGVLDPEELAVVSMVQFKVSQSLNLTSEDERDQMNASKIIYHSELP